MDFVNDKTIEDEMFMLAAVSLAKRGAGWVSPNPLVGCVIVRNGEIIGQGWHRRYGGLHAEREALADCASRGESPQGATAYVTLEPCCHQGKQPPCTQAIIDSGIARVVVGSGDPNPLVAGKGLAQLREAGIRVDEGVLQSECSALTKEWRHFITKKRPYVIMKYAMTADGKIETQTEKSVWLTGAEARNRVHYDRYRYAAVLVGAGTVSADDPQLTCRYEGETGPLGIKQPLRVVLSAQASIDAGSALVKSASPEAPVLVIASAFAPKQNIDRLEAAGVEVIQISAEGGDSSSVPERDARGKDASDKHSRCMEQLEWRAVLDELGNRGIDTLIVEGGPTVHASLLQSGLVNAVQAYIAGIVFGGRDLRGPVGGAALHDAAAALKLENPDVEVLGNDALITWEVSSCSLD